MHVEVADLRATRFDLVEFSKARSNGVRSGHVARKDTPIFVLLSAIYTRVKIELKLMRNLLKETKFIPTQ